MAKRMLIDATHPEETRVVVVNGTRLEQLDVETSTKKQLKGNIYLAKIVRVEPSLQAAFVDYGGNRHGFLAFSEIHPDYYQIPVADRQALLAAEAENNADDGDDGDNDGVETVGGDEAEEMPSRSRNRNIRNYKIQEVIKRRQIMLVQVVKEERGNKGAALTTYLSLAGRYCVLMPNTGKGGGVSRKITNAQDRRRLKDIMADLDVAPSMAVILRTAGQERSKVEIKRDYDYLMRTWSQIRDTTLESRAPALIHEEANLIKRAIRDIYSADIEEVLVDGDEGYRAAKDFMKIMTPSHAKKVQPYRDEVMPLFHRYQVDSQLDAMHSPTVQLKSGGYVVINQTEALVAIDVNSGRATKERHIEETALKTNLEAADEVARQLRLRDLAGLIVIDFIDMEESRNNAQVERRLKDALKQDRARIQMGRISHFGLLELSRQRLRPSLMETSFETCPHCGGAGMVRSVESASMHILRVIEEEGVRRRSTEVTVSVATPVALYILNNKRSALADIEARYGFQVFLRGDDSLIPPDYRMERVKGAVAPPPGVERVLEVVEPADEAESLTEEEVISAEVGETAETGETADTSEGDGRKRRKRRKRRRRGGDGVEAGAEGTMTAEEEALEEAEEAEGDSEGDAETDGEDEAQAAGTEGDADSEGDGEPKRRRRSRRGGRRRRRSAEATEAGDLGSEMLTDTEAAVAEAEAPQGDEVSGEDAGEPAAAPVVAERVKVAPDADDTFTPRRRRVRRKKAGAEGEDTAEVAAPVEPAAAPVEAPVEASTEAAVEAAAEAQAEAPAEKPKRRSRAKAAPADAGAEDKPKRKRVSRARKAEDAPEPESEPETVAEAAVEAPAEPAAEPMTESPVPEAPAEVEAEAAPLAVETPEPVAAEAPEAEATENGERKPRRGWWNRATSG
ncbi:Rne/Rng family ribonuclease [Novispirillum sp. DQ9]|uniref:Rne/Rng family ribonuclease n=1 Tax=Novispirillum sp. DQ9 TaxID=3398612 RepID=UPI003C79F470